MTVVEDARLTQKKSHIMAKTSPIDFWKTRHNQASRQTRRLRAVICNACPHYHPTTTQCGICGCIMAMKSRIPQAECPIGSWGPETPDTPPAPEPDTRT